MATISALPRSRAFGQCFTGPTKIYETATDEDISAGVRTTFSGIGVEHVSFQPIFANYTGVTVKLQRSLDNSTWADVAGATTSTSGAVITHANPNAPYLAVHVTGTLSASADTLAVWVYGEHHS